MDAIHILGAGGIGCAVGYALRSAGQQVLFVDTNPTKVTAGNRDGVRVGDRPALQAEFIHFDEWHALPGTLTLLCTKCYDNAGVLAKLLPGVQLVPIQNGFDARLNEFGHAFEGIASFVSECEKDRPHTRITRRGELHLGRRDLIPPAPFPEEEGGAKSPTGLCPSPALGGRGSTASGEGSAASDLTPPAPFPKAEGGVRRPLFRVVHVPNIEPIKYTKLMYNAAISPIAAAAGIDNGQLLSVPATRKLFFALLQENYCILHAAGIELGKVGPFHPRVVAWILRRKWLARAMAKFFEPSLRGTYCSMAGEIQKGRTEIDNYNGHLIRLAERACVPCPLNRAVHDLVTKMTAAHEEPTRDVLPSLLTAVTV